MDSELNGLLDELATLERRLEERLAARRAAYQYEIRRRRVIFAADIRAHHKAARKRLGRFLRDSPLSTLITSPIIYSLVVPLALLDLMTCLYQWTCFAIWRIPRVRRADYVVLDRHRLPYLNAVQKLNCVYCGYANGVIAFGREVAARTEQYWCPIKHALKAKGTPRRARSFLDYGDGRDIEEKFREFRRKLREAADD